MSSRKRNLFAILTIVTTFSVLAGERPQPALDPMRGVKADPGFSVTLFAAPPDIGYPVCISAAPTGEVFVAVDENSSLGHAPDRGRVVRCVDSDGDGKADKFTTFCKLDSPRGLFYDNGTLIVLHPPMIEAYIDENNTGVATKHETLVNGLGYDLKFRGADHTTNQIRVGIDGWIYVALGDYGSPNAMGKDGSKLKHRGGGIVRVRTDGTDLEMYAVGTRNICDVAVDPFLNIFTLDNTNDGGGWWERLSHIVQSGNYGYPMLYMNFADENIAPLADYGSGSPVGALYLFEPGFDKDHGDSLYLCEWNIGKVLRFPLVTNGASYKITQQNSRDRITFVEVPKPTDIDVDGQSRLYVSSFKNAQYDYAGKNCGFVVRVTDNNVKRPPFPDLKKASDAELLKHLATPSHVYHVHTQREILRRGVKPGLVEGLTKIAESDPSLQTRVASIYTIKQLLGEKSKDILVKLAAKDELREQALRALTDRKKECANLDVKLFIDALADKNPRVRLQALISLGRIGKIEAAEAMVPFIADADPLIAHIAINNLAELKAVAPAFKALENGDAKLRNGAVRLLQLMHDPAVVSDLIERVDKTQDPYQKQAVLKALCRLYNKEEDWNGDGPAGKVWWTTRPDTTGPYYSPVTWEKSDEIGKLLKGLLASADTETKRFLVTEMPRNRIEFPEIYDVLFKLAEDPAFKPTAVGIVLNKKSLPPTAIPAVLEVATSSKEDPVLRAKAIRGLAKSINAKGGLEAAFKAAASADRSNKDLSGARDDFVRDGKVAEKLPFIVKQSTEAPVAERQLAYSILITIQANTKASKDARDTAAKAIDAGWNNPDSAAALIRAVSDLHVNSYATKVRDAVAKNPALAEAAKGVAKTDANKVTINDMKYEDVLAAAQKEKGDPALGERLYKSTSVNCIACHTVNKADPPKGPYLGDVFNRYKRPDVIESILKPTEKIAQGFETQAYIMNDGLRHTGFIVKRGENEIEIRTDPQTQITLQTKDIKTSKVLDKNSIMPEGLAKELSVQELASIMAYLEKLSEENKK